MLFCYGGPSNLCSKEIAISKTLAETAYEALRVELISCRLAPGAPIKITELSRALGTNPIAIREALSRLSAEGLVVAESQKGFKAAEISAAHLYDLTNVRCEIETLCLERAILVGGVQWEADLLGALHRLACTDEPKHGEASEEWDAAHRLFHEALVAACDSPCLLTLRAGLYDQSERYRKLSVTLAKEARDLNKEHRSLMEAALARDTKLAKRLLVEHLQATTLILLQSFHSFDTSGLWSHSSHGRDL